MIPKSYWVVKVILEMQKQIQFRVVSLNINQILNWNFELVVHPMRVKFHSFGEDFFLLIYIKPLIKLTNAEDTKYLK